MISTIILSARLTKYLWMIMNINVKTVKFDYYRMTFDTFQSQFKDYVKTTFIYPVFSLSKCCGFQVYKDFITSKSKWENKIVSFWDKGLVCNICYKKC